MTFQPSTFSERAQVAHLNADVTPQQPKRSLGMMLWGLAGPIAMGLSYQRNHSIPWAIAHGFVAIPYLAYRGFQAAASK